MINSEDARLVAHVSFSPIAGMGAMETVDSVMKSLRQVRESGAEGIRTLYLCIANNFEISKREK